ncbi:MAG: hypothetical protein PHZ04_05235 [Patescibacteria group bacterium]|nr:hypothetical protein [Patescibacteria group bacterium]MDD5294811.1 hypothetical protein [Patescibacteria group bacterium]MDD5554555.1 hypothetical protein [Patescibacteria group bacterium]
MDELQELKNEIKKIKERNKRVEADKAWETSLARKILVAVLTYIVITLFFLAANLTKPFINTKQEQKIILKHKDCDCPV